MSIIIILSNERFREDTISFEINFSNLWKQFMQFTVANSKSDLSLADFFY